jgi:hypothetical protein
MKPASFRSLIQRDYFDLGVTKEVVMSKLVYETGLCGQSVRAALKGTRISSDAARMLGLWVAKTHHVELDELELVRAPPKPRREYRMVNGAITSRPVPERGDPGKRAEESIEAAVQEAQLPAELACTVQYSCEAGLWRVVCHSRDGTVRHDHSWPELSEALRAVRDAHYGRRNA